MEKLINELNNYWTDVYFYLHYSHEDKITHQAVRILQLIEKKQDVGVNDVSTLLCVSHNTASEHVKRLLDKKYIIKEKNIKDQRKVTLDLTELGRSILHRNTSLDANKLKIVMEQFSSQEKMLIEQAFKLLSDGAKKCMY